MIRPLLQDLGVEALRPCRVDGDQRPGLGEDHTGIVGSTCFRPAVAAEALARGAGDQPSGAERHGDDRSGGLRVVRRLLQDLRVEALRPRRVDGDQRPGLGEDDTEIVRSTGFRPTVAAETLA